MPRSMPLRRVALLLLAALPITAAQVGAEARSARTEVDGYIGQIAGGAVYIDLGLEQGLAAGDTVRVSRGGAAVGRMVVVSTASRASSCRVLESVSIFRVGDRVIARVRAASAIDPEGTSPATDGSEARGRAARRRAEPANQLRGRVSLGSLLSDDLTDSGLDFAQPALSSRITLDRIAGTAVSLTLRQRSRYYDREVPLAGDLSESRWAHKVYELAFEYDEPDRPVRLSVGRFIPDRPRGLGLIDGVLFRVHAREGLSIGVAGGTRPDPVSTRFRSGATTFGVVTEYERGVGEKGSAEVSAAIVGSYDAGEVDREYLYLEGDYGSGGRLSSSNSIEIDMNRGWRGEDGRGLLSLTSLYLTARYRVRTGLTARLSYDTRRSIRDLQNRAVPDSLFDDAFRRGLHAGADWSASDQINVSGGFGVRLRGGARNTLSGSGSVRLRDFPVDDMTTTARIALFRSMLGRGYRPAVGVGLSPLRGLMMNFRGGDTIYDTSTGRDHNPWVGSFLNYRFSRRQYLSASLTGYLSDRLRSARLFAETGLLF